MDSLSQIALGSAVGIAVMGRRTPVWKAALVGAVVGTLPDLDVFIDHGDPVGNMTLHRAESHALPWLTLLSPLLGGLTAWLLRERQHFKRWWLAVWLILITHPLLDWMTVYGTQLWRPFTDHPYAVGSIFIIDPLYTLPLLVGVIAALCLRKRNDGQGLRWNAWGLGLSCAYLLWTFAAQQYVTRIAERNLAAQGLPADKLLVVPAALNSVLWRVVAMAPEQYHEGYYSLFDGATPIRFSAYPNGAALYQAWRDVPAVARIAAFSHGFYKLGEYSGKTVISDLRMGQEPNYSFNFIVGERRGDGVHPEIPQHYRMPLNVRGGTGWLRRRIFDSAAGDPPR